MKDKPKLMDQNNAIAKIGGAILGMICALFNGNLLHIDFHQIMLAGYWDALLKLAFDLAKVGLAGMIGAAGGLFGKKYLFPWFERFYKKQQEKNKKSS